MTDKSKSENRKHVLKYQLRLRLNFFQKNHFKLFLWTIRMQFRQTGGKYIEYFKVFPQFLKTVVMKKICPEKKHPQKFFRMQFSQSPRKISEKRLKSSRSNSATSIANTQTCRHFFYVKNWWSSRSILKEKHLRFPQIRPFFAQYPKWTFLKQSILSHCFRGDVECSWKFFPRLFAKVLGLFAQIPKLVICLDFAPKRRKVYSEKTECSSLKEWRWFWAE